MTKDEIKEAIKTLSVLELSEMVKELEEEWGVSAAAPMALAAAFPGAASADAGEVEEKTEFDVVLKDAGPKKIEVIKVIRQLTSLGLKEAKELAETADSNVLEQVGKDAAEEARGKLETAGATVELT